MRLRALVALVAALGSVALVGCSTTYSKGAMSFSLDDGWELSSESEYHDTYSLEDDNGNVVGIVLASVAECGTMIKGDDAIIDNWMYQVETSDDTVIYTDKWNVGTDDKPIYRADTTFLGGQGFVGSVQMQVHDDHIYMATVMFSMDTIKENRPEVNKILDTVKVG